jgi:hypothetical protein
VELKIMRPLNLDEPSASSERAENP